MEYFLPSAFETRLTGLEVSSSVFELYSFNMDLDWLADL
jgi:hypothetical protein